MAVPVYSLDLYVAKVANGPGRRISFLVAFVFRVIFSIAEINCSTHQSEI